MPHSHIGKDEPQHGADRDEQDGVIAQELSFDKREHARDELLRHQLFQNARDQRAKHDKRERLVDDAREQQDEVFYLVFHGSASLCVSRGKASVLLRWGLVGGSIFAAVWRRFKRQAITDMHTVSTIRAYRRCTLHNLPFPCKQGRWGILLRSAATAQPWAKHHRCEEQ